MLWVRKLKVAWICFSFHLVSRISLSEAFKQHLLGEVHLWSRAVAPHWHACNPGMDDYGLQIVFLFLFFCQEPELMCMVRLAVSCKVQLVGLNGVSWWSCFRSKPLVGWASFVMWAVRLSKIVCGAQWVLCSLIFLLFKSCVMITPHRVLMKAF